MEFENFAQYKEKYVREFLDVLGDQTRLSNGSKITDKETAPVGRGKYNK